ncbi:unnamed protein product [Sphagnum balticum]
MMLECARTRTGATASIQSSQHASAPSTNASNLRALSSGQDQGRFKQKVGKQKVAGAASKQASTRFAELPRSLERAPRRNPDGMIESPKNNNSGSVKQEKNRTLLVHNFREEECGRRSGRPLPSPYAGFGHSIPLSPLSSVVAEPTSFLGKSGAHHDVPCF